ncbi:MAG: hypothetical protein CMH32_02295 [Micavibrio sp.]|nr:hypothetical protein [Micavibrio sp.]
MNEPMLAQFKETEAGQVFCCLHLPQQPRADIAVLVCPPLFGEMIQFHRAFYILSGKLADQGIASLRFDWPGTGDSEGDLKDYSLSDWHKCVEEMALFLMEQTGAKKICFVGSRFGASIAANEALNIAAVDSLVLWEPVIDGRGYLEELEDQHNEFLSPFLGNKASVENGQKDILGFSIPERLWTEISNFSFEDVELDCNLKVLIISQTGNSQMYKESLSDEIPSLWLREGDHLHGWLLPEEGIYDVLIPVNELNTIVEWVLGRYK